MATFFTRLIQANMSFETLPAFPDQDWESPFFSLWLSTLLLLLASVTGFVVNGVTVLIFIRRKKLRNLVNFVLLLDCVCHISLCLLCVPIHLAAAWVLPGGRGVTKFWFVLTILQQVVGNFANLVGLSLTLSIAILRYRRLCWKKKDRLSRANALKWSVTSGTIPTGFALVQSGSSIIFPTTAAEPPIMVPALMIYIGKLVLIFFAILAVFFCYIRVAQRVWSSGAGEEKVALDVSKLKKSKSVHATMHSCIQMVLIVATLCPYLYEETVQTFHYSNNNALGRLSDVVVSTTKNNEQGSTYNSTSDRLWSITVNYILLILGTPLAYVASCHKYREQFVSFFSCRGGGHSPDDAAAPSTGLHRHHQYRKTLPSEIPIKSRIAIEKSVVSVTSKFPKEIIIPQQNKRKATSQSSLPTTTATTATSNSPALSSSWDSSCKEGTQLSSSSLTSSSAGSVPYIVSTTNSSRFPPVNITICMEKKNNSNKLATVPFQHYTVLRRDQDFGHKL